MKADLTRDSFDPTKTFSRVLMQQGRVQLDADWNEQSSILLNLIRRLAADLGGPAWTRDGGFALTTLPGTEDVVIAAGSFYVDGILCELDSTPVAVLGWGDNNVLTVAQWTVDDTAYAVGQCLAITDDADPGGPTAYARITRTSYADTTITVTYLHGAAPANPKEGRVRRLVTYLTQPFRIAPPALGQDATQFYLDVWERLVTATQDDTIREVALNGVDTAARSQVVWQLRPIPAAIDVIANANGARISPAALALQLEGPLRGLLRARVQPAAPSTDPCAIAPDSGYRGPENQLYRVEIHQGGAIDAQPSFKWSRENGAVVFPVAGAATGSTTTTLPLASLGRDDRFGLTQGDWVEPEDDGSVLDNAPRPLLQVQSIVPAARLAILNGTVAGSFGGDPTRHPLLRRWDQQGGDPAAGGVVLDQNGAVPIPAAAGQWIDLEDGVQILFEAVALARFRAGDYWLIPARVATGNVVWPAEPDANGIAQPVARPPDGVQHHYAVIGAPAAAAAASDANPTPAASHKAPAKAKP